jgi:hypothetical protein
VSWFYKPNLKISSLLVTGSNKLLDQNDFCHSRNKTKKNEKGWLGHNGGLSQNSFWATEKNFKILNQGFGFSIFSNHILNWIQNREIQINFLRTFQVWNFRIWFKYSNLNQELQAKWFKINWSKFWKFETKLESSWKSSCCILRLLDQNDFEIEFKI